MIIIGIITHSNNHKNNNTRRAAALAGRRSGPAVDHTMPYHHDDYSIPYYHYHYHYHCYYYSDCLLLLLCVRSASLLGPQLRAVVDVDGLAGGGGRRPYDEATTKLRSGFVLYVRKE